MKLAEALSIRKDLQKRIQQLETRIKSNVKVQEDEEPLEDPNELMKELHSFLFNSRNSLGASTSRTSTLKRRGVVDNTVDGEERYDDDAHRYTAQRLQRGN